MKVISVRQPWAWAIIHGGKDVENRNWPTNIRGRVAIHAGMQYDLTMVNARQMLRGEFGEPFTSMLKQYLTSNERQKGAIIGTVEIYDCVSNRVCDSQWKADGDEFYCWLLRNPVALREPIPMKGQLGFWTVLDELVTEEGGGADVLGSYANEGAFGECEL